MVYYKCLPCKYYQKNKIIDTKYDNYGIWDCINISSLSNSSEFIIQSAKDTNLPVSLFFFMLAYANGRRLSDDMQLKDVIENQNHYSSSEKFLINNLVGCDSSKQFVDLSTLLDYYKRSKDFLFGFDNGSHFWEYFGEKIRQECYNDLPSRINSYFLSDSTESIDYYQKNTYKSGCTVAKIELLECHYLESFDMKIWDINNNNLPYNECLKNIQSYWESNMYDNKEVPEFLFQGKLKLL